VAERPPGEDNRPVTLYRDDGVVLRTQKLGESDRIITLLTRRHGRVRAVAKGVRRTKSKFGARLEPFTHVDLQLYQGRQLDIATQAEAISSYGEGIVDDYGRYTSGAAMLEMTERLTEEREPAMRMFLLLIGGLKALSSAEHDPGLVLDAFLLRALAVSGYEPSLTMCARCGLLGPHRWFAVAAGGSATTAGRPAPRPFARTRSGSWRRCWAATGRRPTRATPGPAGRRQGPSRRTCSGTSSAACARCRWWSARDASYRHRAAAAP
jgi:DNA repair protein RecO (recombination protein O)